MKPLNHVRALLIAACLIAGATGCKRAPKNPTFIPKPTTVPVAEETTPTTPIASKTPVTTPTTPVGAPKTPVSTPQQADNSGRIPNGPTTTPTDLTGGKLPPENTTPSQPATTSQPIFDPTKATEATKGQVGDRPEGTEDRTTFAAETVHFDYDKSTVKPSERPYVEHVAAYMKNDAKVSLRVEGNCDERGTEEYNRSLGERRALAVREYLVNLGVAPERITTLSFGEDKPVNQGHDEAAWSQNRRAEFVLIHPTNLQ